MLFRMCIISFTIFFYSCKTNEVSTLNSTSTDKFSITFQPVFGAENLILNQKYPINETDSIEINVLRFYISNIEFYNHDKLIHKVLSSYHLIDLDDKKSLKIDLESIQNRPFNKIKCHLGIDSTTNVSGAFGHDLDPTKGMYWTWQSGYINFKLEGKSELCPTRNNQFKYHLGGYQSPFYALQTLEFDINDASEIIIDIDLQAILKNVDLASKHSIMSPSDRAVKLAEIVAENFEIENTN
ncbi:MAG: hypothetical protein ACI97N_002489 [Cognaticolwellia sp.]|jgi:hypothetical protein